MADKNKLKKISAELKKASKMHAAQAEKIENMSKGPSMINIAGAVAGLGKQIKNQKKSTAVGSVAPHSHDSSKDNAQPIPPITPPMPDNITGNIGNNFKVQELGKSMFQGEEMANQFAQRQMDKPVMPPSPDPVGDELGNMFMQPFSRKKTKQEKVNPTKKAKQGLHSSGRYSSNINMNGDPKTKKIGDYLDYDERNVEHGKGNFFQNKNYPNKRSYFAIDSDVSKIQETKDGQQYVTNITGENSPYVNEKRADTLWAGGKGNISGAKFPKINWNKQEYSGNMEDNLKKVFSFFK
jgi:hypothetical protein